MKMSLRMYGWMLALAPRSFVEEYGSEMRRVFMDRARSEHRLLLWAEAIPDVLWTVLREHAALLRQDTLYGWRAFRRKPSFGLTAVLTVALGIAASTAMFTAVDHVLLRPLPYAGGDRLIKLYEDATHLGYAANEPEIADFLEWKAQSRLFEDMAAYSFMAVNLTGSGGLPQRLEGARVNANLFPMLGVNPVLGRWMQEGEDNPGAMRVAVLSNGLWRSRFGADPDVVGRDILLDGAPHRVVGVMPPGFHFPRKESQIWLPARWTAEDKAERGNHYIYVLGKLKQGVSVAEARAEMNGIGKRLIAANPGVVTNNGVFLRPLREEVSMRSRTALYVLLAAAGCVLLIGCANLANLLLARASERRRELAVRTMLGAGRERLIRQLITENLLLSMAGGLVGMVLAWMAVPLLGQLVPPELPAETVLHMDFQVLGFGAALAALTGILFSWGPAWQLTRESELAVATKEGGRSGAGRDRGRMRQALVIAEVAVSLVLLVCLGLLLRTLLKIQELDPGFRAENVLTLRTALPYPNYEDAVRREQFYRRVLEGVRGLGPVEAAGYVSWLPMTMRGGLLPFSIPGKTAKPEPLALFRVVTPGYFEAMRIPLLAGRYVRENDVAGAARVALVSQSFAARYWGQDNPLGRQLHVLEETRTVVGVVADVRLRGLDRQSEPQVYIPAPQVNGYLFHAPKDLAIRVRGDLMAIAPLVRNIVSEVDKDQAISNLQPMTDLLEQETTARRLQLKLLALFAGITFLLAGTGLYGLLSFVVSQRTQEIGVRMALGARAGDVLRMVMKQGTALALAGVGIGGVVAFWVTQAMDRLLFGVAPGDAVSFAASIGLCLVAAWLACYLPARRAAKVDPITAIRTE